MLFFLQELRTKHWCPDDGDGEQLIMNFMV